MSYSSLPRQQFCWLVFFCPLYKRVVPAYWNVFYSLWDRPWLNTFRTKTFVQFWSATSGGALFKNCLFLICLLLRRWLWKWESDFFMQERRKGKFQRDTFWNEHHLDAQKEHQILFFSLSLFLSVSFQCVCSLHLTSPSSLLMDLRGVLISFPWLFSRSYLKKCGFIVDTKQETEFLKKRSLGPRVDRRKEFLKLDNRMLMNATLELVQLKCISECDAIFVGIVFSQFVLLTRYLICFSEKGAYVKMWRRQKAKSVIVTTQNVILKSVLTTKTVSAQ